MKLHYNQNNANGAGQGLQLSVTEGEQLHLLHPEWIAAFRGSSSQREDRFLNFKGMYRKKKWLQSIISGPAELMLAPPPGYYVRETAVEGDNPLLFDIRNVLYYTSGIRMKTVVLSVKNMLVTRDFLKMKFSGGGQLGIVSLGPVQEMKLDPLSPLYLDAGSLLAYPEQAKAELCVYGNHLAAQHMNYQWQLTGEGTVLLQTGKRPKPGSGPAEPDDNLFKRILREVIPFGGVFIK